MQETPTDNQEVKDYRDSESPMVRRSLLVNTSMPKQMFKSTFHNRNSSQNFLKIDPTSPIPPQL